MACMITIAIGTIVSTQNQTNHWGFQKGLGTNDYCHCQSTKPIKPIWILR
jgi:hypothetical protein